MAPTRRSSTSNSGSGSTLSVTVPSGTASGDVLVLQVTQNVSSGTYGSPSDGTWTAHPDVTNVDIGSNVAHVWYKEADGTESGSITVSGPGSGQWVANCIAVQGTDIEVTDTDGVTDLAGDTSVATGTVTSGSADGMHVIGSHCNDNVTHTPPSGYTEDSDNVVQALGYDEDCGTGAQTVSWTCSPAEDQVGWSVLIEEASGPQTVNVGLATETDSALTVATVGGVTGAQPGDRYVRRQSAARTGVSNTTVADFDYDTEEIADFGSWSSAEVTVDNDGKYLVVHGTGEAATPGSGSRHVGTNSILVNGSSQGIHGLTTHRYVRVSGGADEGVSLGAAILDLTDGDTVGSQIDGTTYADAVGSFDVPADAGGAFQILRLPDGDFLELERTSNQALSQSDINATRPWLDSSGTWTKITWPTENSDDGNWHVASSGDVTLPANGKFIVVYTLQFTNTDTSRSAIVSRLNVGGTNCLYASAYHRNTSAQGCATHAVYFHETGGSTETLYVEATMEAEGTDNGTMNCQRGSLQVLQLNDDAEWIHVDNGATDSQTSDLASDTTWYTTPLSSTVRSDGDSNLSLDSGNNAVQNDSGGSLPVLAVGWLNWDRDSTSSGTRKVPTSRFNDGSAVNQGWGGAFSRGQQSGDDTWHAAYVTVATLDLANGADLTLETRDQASGSNSDMGVYASTNRHFIGLQVLNLESLVDAAGGSPQTVNVGLATETDTAQAVSVSAGAVTATLNQGVETDSSLAVTASAGTVSTAVGISSDTETALAVTPTAGAVTVAVGLASETDSAQAVTPVAGAQTVAVGLASETDSALGVAVSAGATTKAVGLSTETDTGLETTISAGAVTVAVGLATETDTGLTVTTAVGAQTVAVGIASDTSTALAVTASVGAVSTAVGVGIESDTALTVTPAPGSVTVAVGLATETDTALTATPTVGAQSVAVGTATETDTAHTTTPAAGNTNVAATQPAETDSALPVIITAGATTVQVGVATETDTATAVAVVATTTVTFGEASETDTALAVTATPGPVTVPVGTAVTTATALPVTASPGATSVQVSIAVETSTALPVTGVVFSNPLTGLATLEIHTSQRVLEFQADIRGLAIDAVARSVDIPADARDLTIQGDGRPMEVQSS